MGTRGVERIVALAATVLALPLVGPVPASAVDDVGGPDHCADERFFARDLFAVTVTPSRAKPGRPITYTVRGLDVNRMEIGPVVLRSWETPADLGRGGGFHLEGKRTTGPGEDVLSWTFVPPSRSRIGFSGAVYCGPGSTHGDLAPFVEPTTIGFTPRRLGRPLGG